MLSTGTRLRLKEILARLANGEEVGLQERFFLQKHADRDQSIRASLNKAKRSQQNESLDSIDNLLYGFPCQNCQIYCMCVH